MAEAADIITHYADMRQQRYLRYATFTHDTGEFVGTCGYHFYDVIAQQVEIGYDVWKAYWRQGYASENAHAVPAIVCNAP
jgi:ribosomal-protein-alanine N-acetyltransferase